MVDDIEPLSTESYVLADFNREEWMDRPEYCEYQGIALTHLKRLHAGAELHVCDGHIAFVAVKRSTFEIWLYDIVTWTYEHVVRSALPSFLVLGRTWEGVTEIQACPAVSPLPDQIIAQMQWVKAFVAEKGWVEDV
jgi:hypothetical protein